MSIARTGPSIKICGLRDEATILSMDGLPITEVGLVFAPSKRQVTVEHGARLAKAIKQLSAHAEQSPRVAGVFVNLELSSMEQLLEAIPLDIVQLHGQEPLSYYAELKEKFPHISLWKVVSIKAEQADAVGLEAEQRDDGQAAEVKSGAERAEAEHIDAVMTSAAQAETDHVAATQELLAPYAPYIDAVLLDAPGGGTGKPFNWEAIRTYKQAVALLDKKLIVAGGLHEGNVGELLSHYEVDGVDVSSGVETEGIKDIKKIKQFVRRVIEA